MIDLATAEKVHSLLIDEFGGSKGIRDTKGLEAALARPYSTFDGIDLSKRLQKRLLPYLRV